MRLVPERHRVAVASCMSDARRGAHPPHRLALEHWNADRANQCRSDANPHHGNCEARGRHREALMLAGVPPLSRIRRWWALQSGG